MKCLRSLWTKFNNAVLFADCFAPPILLRYNSLPKKSTKTGGFISIILLIILSVFFVQSWFDVLDKKQVNSQRYYVRDLDPSQKQITRQDFMFTVSIAGFNIVKDRYRHFDVIISEQIRINSTYSESNQIKMVPCEKQDFDAFGQEIAAVYDKLHLQNSLCFPKDFHATLRGKWASPDFRYLRIHVKRCQGNQCTSQQQFQEHLRNHGAFFINYYFINKLINPTNLEPISIYFEDKNYNMVNDIIAIDTNLYLSEFIMETDQSLWPLQDLNVTKGVYVQKTEKQQFVHPAKNGSFAQFHIRKSDQKMIVKRSFRRIDNLLSYIGGLFGISATFFGYIIRRYNRCCFQLQICSKIFSIDGQKNERNTTVDDHDQSACSMAKQDIKSKQIDQSTQNSQVSSFNIWVWVKYLIYQFIKLFYQNFSWKSTQKFAQKLYQSRNQMNVDTLLHKISFYERAFQCLFDDDQIMLLYLQQKISIQQLKRQRLLMNIDTIPNQEQPGNQVANQYIQMIQNKRKNSRYLSAQSLAMIFQGMNSQKNMNLINTYVKHNLEPGIVKNIGNRIQLTQQISMALNRIKRRAQNGQKVCERILQGVCKQLTHKFQEDNHVRKVSHKQWSIIEHKKQNCQVPNKQTPRISAFKQIRGLLSNNNQNKYIQQKQSSENKDSKSSKNSLPLKKIKIFDVGTTNNIQDF